MIKEQKIICSHSPGYEMQPFPKVYHYWMVSSVSLSTVLNQHPGQPFKEINRISSAVLSTVNQISFRFGKAFKWSQLISIWQTRIQRSPISRLLRKPLIVGAFKIDSHQKLFVLAIEKRFETNTIIPWCHCFELEMQAPKFAWNACYPIVRRSLFKAPVKQMRLPQLEALKR